MTSSSCVGSVVPIPTDPIPDVTVTKVPPTPTFNPVSPTSKPFPTVKIPTVLLNTKSDDVAKSPKSLNNTLPFNPGGAAVIVAIFPGETPLT